MTYEDKLAALLEDVTLLRQLPPVSERRAIRQQAGLSLDTVAAVIGCSRQAVMNWERGRSEPQGLNRIRYLDILTRLAES